MHGAFSPIPSSMVANASLIVEFCLTILFTINFSFHLDSLCDTTQISYFQALGFTDMPFPSAHKSKLGKNIQGFPHT